MEKWLVEILNSFKKEVINSDSNLFLIKGKTGAGKTIFGVDLGMNLRGNKKVLIVNHLLSDLGVRKEEAILRQFFLSFDKISIVNKFEPEKINTDEVGVLIFDNLECLEFQEFLDFIKISQTLNLKVIFISHSHFANKLSKEDVEKFNTIYSKIE